MLDTLTALCSINGASGDESAVRDFILKEISPYCEKITVNPLGCIIAEKHGKVPAKKKVMISAHMDEVGLIVTYINPDGTLSFSSVGGVNADVCAGRQVTVNGFDGVIGTVAYHHLSSDKRKNPITFSEMYIDIGAKDSDEAGNYVKAGDFAYFKSDTYISESGFLTAKAIDDRAGCACLIEMIKKDMLTHDAVFTFVTEEEVGLRGARTAAYTVAPDFAVVIEATTAADIPLAEGADKCCICGNGTVISYMDKSTIYDRELYNAANKLAERNNIKCQTKSLVAGGNDSGAIHLTRGGIRTLAFSVPCRYLHSPSCTAKISDIEDTLKLSAIFTDFCAGGTALE